MSRLTDVFVIIHGVRGSLRYLLDSETEDHWLVSRRNVMRKWLDYWVVIASIGTLEKVVGLENLMTVAPMWSVLKGCVIGWMLLAGSSEWNREKMQNTKAEEAEGKAEKEKHDQESTVCASL